MDDREHERQLRTEGFKRAYVWHDSAHTHATLTAHINLEGEMMLTVGGQSKTYRAGERCDVPAGAVHLARMGPRDWRHLIGEW